MDGRLRRPVLPVVNFQRATSSFGRRGGLQLVGGGRHEPVKRDLARLARRLGADDEQMAERSGAAPPPKGASVTASTTATPRARVVEVVAIVLGRRNVYTSATTAPILSTANQVATKSEAVGEGEKDALSCADPEVGAARGRPGLSGADSSA